MTPIPLDLQRALDAIGIRPPAEEKAQPAKRQFKGEFYKPGQEIPF
jgi:hypothetical protein